MRTSQKSPLFLPALAGRKTPLEAIRSTATIIAKTIAENELDLAYVMTPQQ